MDGISDRGVIRNRVYANQVRDFSGLRYGNMTPTDFDMVLDYHDKCWAYGEFKYKDTELPFGQRLALERQCDDMAKVKPALAIIASHDCAPSEDIDCANTVVSEFRFRGKWRVTETVTTTRELIDRFFHWVELEKEQP